MESLVRDANFQNEANPDYQLFNSAEEAWLWFCKYESMVKSKPKNSSCRIVRPCYLDDIYIAVSRLYLARKISERHVKTLIKYGKLQLIPDERISDEYMEAMWWQDAMDKLEILLIKKGIVICKDTKQL